MTSFKIGAAAMLLLLGGNGAAAAASPAQSGQLALFQQAGFNGQAYYVDRDRPSVETMWTVGSVAVHPGETWQICSRNRYQGRCVTVSDSVSDTATIGMAGQISSARRIREGH
jgi:hypothetical protein